MPDSYEKIYHCVDSVMGLDYFSTSPNGESKEVLKVFIDEAAVQDERERCAKLVESYGLWRAAEEIRKGVDNAEG